MNQKKKFIIIKKSAIFENLPDEDIKRIADVAIEESYPGQSIIFKENEIADAFYIIAEGTVEILKAGKVGRQEILAIKRPFELFGEMAVIDELPRSATIKAKTKITLLKVSKQDFAGLARLFSHISLEIARSICQTVRNSNKTYIRDLEKRNKQLEVAYDKLKKTQAELIKAEKLSVIGQFASIIIHDIRNPMANIRAYTELIKITEPHQEKISRATQIIIKEVDHLTNMTSELLEFTRGEIELNKTPVLLTSFIETLIDTVKEKLRSKNIEIIFKQKCDQVILIDPEKISRVFQNLISNAEDAIITNGTIEISIEEKDKKLIWMFNDTGNGMDKETLANLFEPFFTKKKKGTGLGMAIVKGIVESHGGKIHVLSELDAGTQFKIVLPLI